MLEEKLHSSLSDYMKHWLSVFCTFIVCLIIFPIALIGIVLIYTGKMLTLLGLLFTLDFTSVKEFFKNIWNVYK